MRRVRRRWPLRLAVVAGIAVGVWFAVWRIRAPAPLALSFLGHARLVSTFARSQDQHLVRTWMVPGDLDGVVTKAEAEFSADPGWQPPLVMKANPKVVQITRVRTPKGDFQFVRLLFSQDGPGQVQVVMDEGPIQQHAFR